AAPISTPAAAPPVSPSPTAPITLGAAPDQPAVPAAAAPAIGAEPKAEDFGDDVMGYVKAKWEYDNKQEGEQPAAEAQPGDQPAVEQPAVEQPAITEPAATLTPESIAALETSTPALKELFDANPAIKGQFYKMARENAKLAPLAEIFPNKESAQFAHDTANSMVAIRTSFQQAINDPTKVDQAFNLFVDEFRIVDKDGNPVIDPKTGEQQLAPDFDLIVGHATEGRFAGEMADLKELVKADKFPNEQARENHKAALAAYKFIEDFRKADPLDLERPDLSETPDHIR